METRVAVISIIVKQGDSVEKLNNILHEYSQYIIGRMGVPYRQKGISIISIAIDAPQNVISTLSGRIGKLPDISVKTAFSGVITNEE
ncbi:MAG: iron-only hydrogenase system regulator [Clostridia bacterium]|nr:iron-only hydrogenase system regulator [Clostridia bacterium]